MKTSRVVREEACRQCKVWWHKTRFVYDGCLVCAMSRAELSYLHSVQKKKDQDDHSPLVFLRDPQLCHGRHSFAAKRVVAPASPRPRPAHDPCCRALFRHHYAKVDEVLLRCLYLASLRLSWTGNLLSCAIIFLGL